MEFKKIISGFFFTAAIITTSSVFALTKATLPLQMNVDIYQSPTPLKAEDKNYLVYEIYLTNYMREPAKLTGIKVDSGSKTYKLNTQELQDNIRTVNPQSEKTPLVFQSGESKTVYMFLELNNNIPTKLIHTFDVDSSINNESAHFVLNALPLPIKNTPPVIVSAPLHGKNWLIGNGISNTSIHRRTGLVLNGHPYYPQRYAIDFIQMGADGKSYSGDIHQNTSYHCYGQDIYAVADGTVVELQDNIPENIPNSDKLAVPMTTKTLPGNHLVIDLGNGKYAGYAHLIPGSLKVKIGDKVTRGQVIAKLGNSGNSSEPHLHFQIIDGRSFLASNGIPYGFEHFLAQPSQYIDNEEDASFQIKLLPGDTKKYLNQLPLENAVISFD